MVGQIPYHAQPQLRLWKDHLKKSKYRYCFILLTGSRLGGFPVCVDNIREMAIGGVLGPKILSEVIDAVYIQPQIAIFCNRKAIYNSLHYLHMSFYYDLSNLRESSKKSP